ncbi:scavenger receptor cysteine-rich type 1 protein M130 isoform X10 [Astyanax mexicanus]|uniref:scavenger receptor cysteine-rich type 1 protein M130 isoform X10 n=1 Tax=Astyanax mexicanus TaxID=7994 RepID=UPI0020CB4C04|nr:scavenger receptor cysteine-rich type 1 protein M130 isoform X10 [Astyanax mexicanus]
MSHVKCTGSESTLKHCGSLGWGEHSCNHNMDIELTCSDHRTSRLADGPHVCSGRVEVFHGASWFTVCDADFVQQDAEVVCRELGCGSPVEILGAAAFGKGKGQVWSEELQCRGDESEITLCPITSSHKYNCSHGHTQARLMNGSDSCSGRVELQYLSSSLASHEGGVRLSGGMECEGEVEVFFRQEWRRVLLDSWSESEASVVCRQLGCGSVLNTSSSSSSSPEHSYVCVTGFNCSGSEAHLRNCSSSQAVNCSSTEQIYITCSGYSFIRLVGSGGDCAGRLEVFHSGSWGTVSDELWDIEDAQVVCRQLQCGVALSAPVPARFGSGTGPIWLNEVECEGNEASMWNCRYQLCGEDECGHKDDVGVVCSEYKEIRLTEGCEGNLEVFYNGTWGNVCNNGMDVETMGLICRELNCGRFKTERATKARVESAPNWLDDVKCRKHDSTLFHCPSSSWSQNSCDRSSEVTHITSSGEKKQLAFENLQKFFLFPNQGQCSNYMPIRLRGGEEICSGRLEVYHNAEWGSVCADLWDIRDAQVVCRQLGCGPALSANRRAADGSGGGTIWMNRVKCRGNEIHLWDCPHSLKIHTGCSHSAGVTCADIFVTLPFSSETTTTYTTVPAQLTEKKTVPPSKIPSSNFPYIYPVSLLVLGSVLFLALVLLVVLFYQNRVLRRVISKRRKTSAEPVYEEIDTRLIPKRITVSTESKADNEEMQLSYDVIFAGQTPDSAAEEEPDNYDDVIVEQNSNIVMGL